MYRIVFLWFGSLLLLGCQPGSVNQPLPYYNTPDFTPIFLTNQASVNQAIPHTIAQFSFLNQDSVQVSSAIVDDKIHIANFIFTSCGSICPTLTRHLKIVSDSLQNDTSVVFLSYSVTPWIDTPSVLKKYKTRNAIHNPRWHFLTGAKADIYALGRQSYFAEEDIGFSKDSTEFLHTEHCILVDKTRRIRGVYNGTLALEMQHLLEDIRTLQAEQE